MANAVKQQSKCLQRIHIQSTALKELLESLRFNRKVLVDTDRNQVFCIIQLSPVVTLGHARGIYVQSQVPTNHTPFKVQR